MPTNTPPKPRGRPKGSKNKPPRLTEYERRQAHEDSERLRLQNITIETHVERKVEALRSEVVRTAKSEFSAIFDKLIGVTGESVGISQFEEWVVKAAARDPGKAADLTLRLAEFFLPKLGRTEHTGEDGGPITVHVVEAKPRSPRAADQTVEVSARHED